MLTVWEVMLIHSIVNLTHFSLCSLPWCETISWYLWIHAFYMLFCNPCGGKLPVWQNLPGHKALAVLSPKHFCYSSKFVGAPQILFFFFPPELENCRILPVLLNFAWTGDHPAPSEVGWVILPFISMATTSSIKYKFIYKLSFWSYQHFGKYGMLRNKVGHNCVRHAQKPFLWADSSTKAHITAQCSQDQEGRW